MLMLPMMPALLLHFPSWPLRQWRRWQKALAVQALALLLLLSLTCPHLLPIYHLLPSKMRSGQAGESFPVKRSVGKPVAVVEDCQESCSDRRLEGRPR